MFIETDHEIMTIGVTPILSDVRHFLSGVSPAMRSLERVIADVAPTDIPILLGGESGTGKEVVALEFHRRSQRKNQAFLKCTCGSVTTELLSAHLSPTEKGQDEARGTGTIFLDEVNLLNSVNQDYLLQLLQDDRMESQRSAAARVISATTQNLEDEMHGGRFRQELYYRINGIFLRLPSLRDRKEDIPLLLEQFLKKYASLFGLAEPHLGSATMNVLLQYPWPGNVRELENFARKTVALQDEQLALGDLAAGQRSSSSQSIAKPDSAVVYGKIKSLKEASREASRKAERELIVKALDRTRWNRKRTARELQISYKALLYKLKQLGLDGASDSPLSTGEVL